MCVKAIYLLAIFAANSHALCQPNAMQICSDIIANSHCVLCVKAFNEDNMGCCLDLYLLLYHDSMCYYLHVCNYIYILIVPSGGPYTYVYWVL